MAKTKKQPSRRNIVIIYAACMVGYFLSSFAMPLITSRAELIGYDTAVEAVQKFVVKNCDAYDEIISDFSEPDIFSGNDTNIMCIHGGYTVGGEKYNYYAFCRKLPFFDIYYLDHGHISLHNEDNGNGHNFWTDNLLFKGRIYIPASSSSEPYINEGFNYKRLSLNITLLTIPFVIAFFAVPKKQKSNK